MIPSDINAIRPFYLPWVGKNTTGSEGVRWHVMGESHYLSEGPDAYTNSPQLTRQIVADWGLAETHSSAFFTRVAAVIAHCDPSRVDRAAAWQSIAYSNFIQEPMSGPRIAPTPQQSADACRLFCSQLASTRPEVLVVLGNRLWQQLPTDMGCSVPTFQFAPEPDWLPIEDAWIYPYHVEGVLVCTVAVKIVHPSAGHGRWNWEIAAQRVHGTARCHSNILEWFYDTV